MLSRRSEDSGERNHNNNNHKTVRSSSHIKIEILFFFFAFLFAIYFYCLFYLGSRYPKRRADCVAIVRISRKTKATNGEIRNNSNKSENYAKNILQISWNRTKKNLLMFVWALAALLACASVTSVVCACVCASLCA